MNRDSLEVEEAYRESLSEPLEKAEKIGQADIVVGISFRNEAGAVGHVCETLLKGVTEFFPDKKCVLVCAGGREEKEALQLVQEVRLPRTIELIGFLMKDELVSGKVWTVRAITAEKRHQIMAFPYLVL